MNAPPRYVLDTNVVSELMRPLPAPPVLAWFDGVTLAALAITAVTIMEVRFGIAALPAGRRRDSLEQRFGAFLAQGFGGVVLPFDMQAAQAAATIRAVRQVAGAPISVEDAMIAGIARAAGMVVITRDGGGFAGCGVAVVDPWVATPP